MEKLIFDFYQGIAFRKDYIEQIANQKGYMNGFPQKQLLVNYLLGICTTREQEEVEEWLDKDEGHIFLLEQVAKELGNKNRFPTPEKRQVKKGLLKQIAQTSDSAATKSTKIHAFPEPGRSSFYKRRGFWIKVAAVLLVISVAGISGTNFYFGEKQISELQSEPVFKQSTLSYGQTASLQFGDGSVIKLNGGSSLRYPESFGPNERKVYLEGEAFFEIAHDEARSFTIYAGGTKTRVLGTSFNIKAYEDSDEVRIAVEKGKIAVSRPEIDSDNTVETVFLEENQWLAFLSGGQILEKGEGDIREMIAWKDRILLFSNKSFAQVAEMLERWYGVEIVIEDPDLKTYILEGEHLDLSLEEVLNSLKIVVNFDYSINGNNVRIYKDEN